MSGYFKVPATSHYVNGLSSIIHVPTITMVYERSLNNVLGLSYKAPWTISNRHFDLKKLMVGGTVITDNPDHTEFLGRVKQTNLLGKRRIVVSEKYAKEYNFMAVEQESIADSLPNAIIKALQNDHPPIWIIGSDKLLEQASHYADYVIETIVMNNMIRHNGGFFKYEGKKEILEFDRSDVAVLPDGLTAEVEHRLYKTHRKLPESKPALVVFHTNGEERAHW